MLLRGHTVCAAKILEWEGADHLQTMFVQASIGVPDGCRGRFPHIMSSLLLPPLLLPLLLLPLAPLTPVCSSYSPCRRPR